MSGSVHSGTRRRVEEGGALLRRASRRKLLPEGSDAAGWRQSLLVSRLFGFEGRYSKDSNFDAFQPFEHVIQANEIENEHGFGPA